MWRKQERTAGSAPTSPSGMRCSCFGLFLMGLLHSHKSETDCKLANNRTLWGFCLTGFNDVLLVSRCLSRFLFKLTNVQLTAGAKPLRSNRWASPRRWRSSSTSSATVRVLQKESRKVPSVTMEMGSLSVEPASKEPCNRWRCCFCGTTLFFKWSALFFPCQV